MDRRGKVGERRIGDGTMEEEEGGYEREGWGREDRASG